MSRIPYVPSAALLVRRGAVHDELFDPRLRGGEDVDLVWRLAVAGWDVRYEPSSTVRHDGPGRVGSWLGRRAFYGTTAGTSGPAAPGLPRPAAAPRPGRPASGPWPRRAGPSWPPPPSPPRCCCWPGGSTGSSSTRSPWPPGSPARGTIAAVRPAVRGLARAWSPALVLALGWRRTRSAAALALLVPAVGDWVADRAELDPFRYAALHVADDLAYGAGVWLGCLHARTPAPLVPRIVWRSPKSRVKGHAGTSLLR